MINPLGFTQFMGPKLRKEVEKQLLEDLKHYGINGSNLTIDWSETFPNGHVTKHLDGELENWSGVKVMDTEGRLVAEGWLDFIHGGNKNPLFTFWNALVVNGDTLKPNIGIPDHIWDRLPETSKRVCRTKGKYDAHWNKDPKVLDRIKLPCAA